MYDKQMMIARVAGFVGQQILVIGDVILDEYITGRAERLSREAPIPVLEYLHDAYRVGGAANPAMNIAGLGGAVTQIGVIGDDVRGQDIHHLLRGQGVQSVGLVMDGGRPTTTKTRIMAQTGHRTDQQIARIDRISRDPIRAEIEAEVIAQIRHFAGQQVALIVSDYLSGVVTQAVVDAVRHEGRKHGALLAADAQGRLEKYADFDLVKCNADEASSYLQRPLTTDDDFAEAGRQLLNDLGLKGMLITRGAAGMTLVEADNRVTHLAAAHIEAVYDTVGAGDTVVAVMTLALTAGAGYPEAAELASIAAGIVIRHVGNYAPSPSELIGAIQG